MIAAMASAPGCHAFYTVSGTVTSCRTGAPITGAKLDLSYPGERGVNETEADGTFTVGVNDPPGNEEATLVVTAPGYQPETRTVHDKERVEVCLEEAAGE